MKNEFQLAGKRILVVGLARTGIATALFCASRGAHVTATESNPPERVADAVAKLDAAHVQLELGGHKQETFLKQDLIVPSPGVPYGMEHLAAARAAGIPVWSEIELASRFLKGKLIAITGSNGKTTSTALTGHILETAGVPVIVAGNIGTPLISRVETSSDATITVAEVSSFQLENIAEFRPDVAAILNLTPDHLDRHASFDEYANAKARLFENQTAADAAILNADDPASQRFSPLRAQRYSFSRMQPVSAGTFVRDGKIRFRNRDGAEIPLLETSVIGLRGSHNLENVLAASASAFLVGASPANISEGVRTFAGVEHRLEFVAEISGVSFYNDSKATNVDATLKAIDAFPGNLLVILGGKDKGSSYSVLADSLKKRARMVITIGAAAEKITSELHGTVEIVAAGTIDKAVRTAMERAHTGDTVLLAPACASFDQFENYEQRGRVFKQLVRQLERERSAKAS
ncbi:MAG: UDP-N-acetylmuramoyl-L-alanine--D-glutamate ligase [Acidobacteria bacterium]|nr:UDP-N-acetylmuramoyl-L-alanine--D-glutamate ligase [Acidobacteriota bacterium]